MAERLMRCEIRWLLVALLVQSGWIASARAATPYVPKVMVFDLNADPSFRPATLRAMNDFLAGAVHDQGFRVLTREDIGAAVGLDKQKKLLGCNDSNCLAEIGGALGADYIVRGNVALLDRNIAVTLSLIDPKGQSVNQVRDMVETDSASDLLRTLEHLVPRLMAPVSRPRVQPPDAAAGGLTASNAPVDNRGPGAGTYALVGGGVTAVIAGSVLGIMSLVSLGHANDAAASGNDFSGDASASVTEGRIGVPLLALGVAAVVTGAVIWASSSDASTAPAAGGP